MKELQAIVRALVAPNAEPAVLATLVRAEGSSYRRPGARLLVQQNGTRIGSISGGCLEEDVIAHARHVAATGSAKTVVYDTTSENDVVWGVGLGCHGVVRVLIERVEASPAWACRVKENFAARQPTRLAVVYGGESPAHWGTRLAEFHAGANDTTFCETVPPLTRLCIFGAGDDAQPLAALAHRLGWTTIVADPRPAYATPERFPTAETLIVGPAEDLVQRAAPGGDSLAVIMTHHYVHDVPVLRALLPLSLPYVGLLGPKKRAEKILADLGQHGFASSAEQQSRVHAPIGLDLGADDPEQIAIAIVAEIQSVLNGRDARPLRERIRPIHE